MKQLLTILEATHNSILNVVQSWILTFSTELFDELHRTQSKRTREGEVGDFLVENIMRSHLIDFGIVNDAEKVREIRERLQLECNHFYVAKDNLSVMRAASGAFCATQSLISKKSKERAGLANDFVKALENYLVAYVQNDDEIDDEALKQAFASLLHSTKEAGEIEGQYNQFKSEIEEQLHTLKTCDTKKAILEICQSIFSNHTLRNALVGDKEHKGQLLDALITSMGFYLLRNAETDVYLPKSDSEEQRQITSMSMFAWLLDCAHIGFLDTYRRTANERMQGDIFTDRHTESEGITRRIRLWLKNLNKGDLKEDNADLYLIKLITDFHAVVTELSVAPKSDKSEQGLSEVIDSIRSSLKAYNAIIFENLSIIKKIRSINFMKQEEAGSRECVATNEILSILEKAYYQLGALIFYYHKLLKETAEKEKEIAQDQKEIEGKIKKELTGFLSSDEYEQLKNILIAKESSEGVVSALEKVVEDAGPRKLGELLRDNNERKELLDVIIQAKGTLDPNYKKAVGEIKKLKEIIAKKMQEDIANIEKYRDAILTTYDKTSSKHGKSVSDQFKKQVCKDMLATPNKIIQSKESWLSLLESDTEEFIRLFREDPLIEMLTNWPDLNVQVQQLEGNLKAVREGLSDINAWLDDVPRMLEQAKQIRLMFPKSVSFGPLMQTTMERLGMTQPLEPLNKVDEFSSSESFSKRRVSRSSLGSSPDAFFTPDTTRNEPGTPWVLKPLTRES